LKSFWVLFEKLLGSIRKAKPSQTKPSQAKPNQTKPSQTKPSQAKPSQAIFFNTLRLFCLKGSGRYSKSFWVLFEKLLGSIRTAKPSQAIFF